MKPDILNNQITEYTDLALEYNLFFIMDRHFLPNVSFTGDPYIKLSMFRYSIFDTVNRSVEQPIIEYL